MFDFNCFCKDHVDNWLCVQLGNSGSDCVRAKPRQVGAQAPQMPPTMAVMVEQLRASARPDPELMLKLSRALRKTGNLEASKQLSAKANQLKATMAEPDDDKIK